jgi:3-hydroxyacyl-CoA dehydrogenase/enoyl-CoA hydratase/3-hydroxybutyryl-CoA epimerase
MITYSVLDGAAILTWEMPDRSVNVMNDQSLAIFAELIERAAKDEDVRGIIVTSSRRDFVVGADLVSFLSDRTPSVIFEKARKTQAILRRLETIGKPVCAAINGSALGGGMEIALACHYRVAADVSALRLGLPEVTLGLLAGAGGTQRLPRLLGLRRALPLLLEGTTLSVGDARRIGMIDEVVEADKLLERAQAWLASHTGTAVQPWDRKGYHLPDGPFGPAEIYDVFANETAKVVARTLNNLPAPGHILSAVFEGCQSDIDTGLKAEARHFVSCVCSSASRNIIRTSFFGVADAAKLKGRPKGLPVLKLDRLGVVGAGPVAQDLVNVAVRSGIEVLWFADGGKGPEQKVWPVGEDLAEVAKKIVFAESPEALGSCQVIIDTSDQSTEELALLGKLTAVADPILVAGIYAGKQSIPLRGLYLGFAKSLEEARLVEIIRGSGVPDISVAHAMDFVKQIGKVPLVVDGAKGSYLNRVHNAYVAEGRAMLAEGVAPALVRNAARQSGMMTNPIEDDEVFPGKLPALKGTIPADGRVIGLEFSTLKRRLLNVQVIEAMHCLDQGLVSSPLDADIGAFLGWGFSRHLGGPFGLVDTLGARKFTEQCEELAKKYGSRFRPPKMLQDHIEANKAFHTK